MGRMMAARVPLAPLIPLTGLALLAIAALTIWRNAPRSPSAAPPPEAERILAQLERGDPSSALPEAQEAVARAPRNPVVRRRLAQARICAALALDRGLDQAAEDVAWAGEFARALTWLRDPASIPRSRREPGRARYESSRGAILTPANVARLSRFRESAWAEVRAAAPIIQRRNRLLARGLEDVKDARRLGDRSTELELTDLWGQVLALLWQQDAVALRVGRLDHAGEPTAEAASTGLADKHGPGDDRGAVLAPLRREDVLRGADRLGRQRPHDATALAGAADVIAILEETHGDAAPWRYGARRALGWSWSAHRGWLSPAADPHFQYARRAYLAARDARTADVLLAPWTVALRLYLSAVAADPEAKLPYLRPRVYRFRGPFEPEEADRLLAEIERQQPQNAFVPLQRACRQLLCENRPARALARLEDAPKKWDYVSSSLAGVPAALREMLRYQRRIRENVGLNGHGYEWAFSLLNAARDAASAARRGQLDMLRLQVADRLRTATDWDEQEEGLGHEARTLARLNPPQSVAGRVCVGEFRRQLGATLRRVPHARPAAYLTRNGIRFIDSPLVRAGQESGPGPLLFLGRPGVRLWVGAPLQWPQ